MRRIIDFMVAIFWLILLSPVFLLINVFINMDSKDAILYTPKMIGHNGKAFSLFRFCTMSKGRVTRVGKFLRNYSLDHLPMLINLLKGDMTLIGPRPMEVNVVDVHDPTWQRYFQVKPGLFNYAVLKLGKLWTPARRTDPILNQELEMEYLQKQSVKFDLQLLVNAVRALFLSKGNIKERGEPDVDVRQKLHMH